jgi:hypothetical protein
MKTLSALPSSLFVTRFVTTFLTTFVTLFLALWLAGCASLPPMPPVETLFDDRVFAAAAAATPSIDRSAALASSPAMRSYLAARVPNRAGVDRRKLLLDALYRGDLRLEYDAAVTRTSA